MGRVIGSAPLFTFRISPELFHQAERMMWFLRVVDFYAAQFCLDRSLLPEMIPFREYIYSLCRWRIFRVRRLLDAAPMSSSIRTTQNPSDEGSSDDRNRKFRATD